MIDTPSGAVVPPRQGKSWTVEEDGQLYDGFVGGQPIDTLAAAHKRSAGAIRARLVRLGLIDQEGTVVEPAPPFAAVRRRPSSALEVNVSAAEGDAVRSVFAIRTGDGWVVELKSNRPLDRLLVDRLTSMLHGVLAEDDKISRRDD
jgi:hypothetical protein